MNNKKFLFPLVLIVLFVVSLSAVSAADDVSAVASNAVSEDVSSEAVDSFAVSSDEISSYNGVQAVTPSGTDNDTQTIQDAIDTAEAGNIIDLGGNTFKGVDNVKVNKTLNINGNGATVNGYNVSTGSNTIFVVQDGNSSTVAGTVISNITFVNTIPTGMNGYGVEILAGNNITVDNCTFINGSSGVYMRTTTNSVVSNSKFTGVTNMSTVGVGKEQGTKAINIMGGNNNTVINNTFDGQVLDAVSIASNAKNVNVIDNIFNNATYGMFFGGGVENTTVTGNTFNTPGVYAVGASKSATAIDIKNNTFVLKNNTLAVHAEQGNDAHGYPSPIGNITVVDNTVEAAEDANPYSLRVMEVYSNGGALTPSGEIVVENNTVDTGITNFYFWDANWGNESNIHVTPEVDNTTTVLTADNYKAVYGDNGNFTCTLTYKDGTAAAGAEVALTLFNRYGDNKTYYRTTNAEGVAKLTITLIPELWYIVCEYDGHNTPIPASNNSTGYVTITAA